MNSLASQIGTPYIGIQNCEAKKFLTECSIIRVLTQSTNTHKVFLFPDPKWAAGIRKWLCAMDCVNNQPSFLMEMKL